jgi:hypothetical protein
MGPTNQFPDNLDKLSLAVRLQKPIPRHTPREEIIRPVAILDIG